MRCYSLHFIHHIQTSTLASLETMSALRILITQSFLSATQYFFSAYDHAKVL